MRAVTPLLVGSLALAGCGEAGMGEQAAPEQRPGGSPSPQRDAGTGGTPRGTDDVMAAAPDERDGTIVVTDASPFGRMLFDSKRQAIYVFENDPRGRSVCYGECAEAWPPVLTRGTPVARRGVKASLLGTVKRRGGERQVTYAGKPLYYYAHEAPGEVRCHNVDLNGGLWWVVGPDGRPRP